MPMVDVDYGPLPGVTLNSLHVPENVFFYTLVKKLDVNPNALGKEAFKFQHDL